MFANNEERSSGTAAFGLSTCTVKKGGMFFCLRTTQGEKVIPLIAVRIGHFHDDVT